MVKLYKGENNTFNKQNTNFRIKEFNQNDKRLDYNFCTIFSSMGTILTNTGYEFTQDDLVEASLEAKKKGIVKPKGAKAPNAMGFIEDYVNNNFNINIVGLRFDIYKEYYFNEFLKALNNGWAFSQFYKSSNESYKDIQEDGVADQINYKKGKVGHMTNIVMLDGEITSINSYKGENKYNRHTWKHFKELLDNNFIYPVAYTFIPKPKNMPEHISTDNLNEDEANIVIEWQRIVNKAIENKNYVTIYNVYTDDYAITKMLIEISNIREKYGKSF